MLLRKFCQGVLELPRLRTLSFLHHGKGITIIHLIFCLCLGRTQRIRPLLHDFLLKSVRTVACPSLRQQTTAPAESSTSMRTSIPRPSPRSRRPRPKNPREIPHDDQLQWASVQAQHHQPQTAASHPDHHREDVVHPNPDEPHLTPPKTGQTPDSPAWRLPDALGSDPN